MPTRRQLLSVLSVASAGLCAPAILRRAHAADDVQARNFEFLGHCEQGDHPDGVQVMVNRKHAYVGGMFSDGFNVVDTTNPRDPKLAAFVPMPKNTRAHHLQAHDDKLFVVNGANPWAMSQIATTADYYSANLADNLRGKADFTSGLRIYDIASPAQPREISFYGMPGFGLHRLWYVGGNHLYASAHLPGYRDHILAVIDVSNISKPSLVATWALPGLKADEPAPEWFKGHRVALHHMIVKEGIGYAAWRDGGYTIHDMRDPAQPKLLSQFNYAQQQGPDGKPLSPGAAHTPLGLPGRKLLVGVDEASLPDCARQYAPVNLVDVSNPAQPRRIGALPVPSDEDYCHKGGIFGPHNVHENRPGSWQNEDTIFVTLHNAGVRAYNIADPANAKEIGAIVPAAPTRVLDRRPGLGVKVVQSTDLFVDADGMTYFSDVNGGLNIAAYKGAST